MARKLRPMSREKWIARHRDFSRMSYEHPLYEATRVLLEESAKHLEVRPGEKRLQCGAVYIHEFSTQGLGDKMYAEKVAHIRFRMPAERLGLQVEVEFDESNRRFDVYLFLEDIYDAEIFKMRKEGLGLRDWIKACWGSGVNPRVMNPFLPHGLEEKLGVDYFGRDVKK